MDVWSSFAAWFVRTVRRRSTTFTKKDVRRAAYKAPPEERTNAALTQRDQ